jgi:D-alanyl-D-alanine carboxypeptidase (penicillin-binding protein 5/6)
MSTARPTRRRLRGCAAAFVAGLLVMSLAPAATALPTETTPPTPVTCPSGQTAATVTQPPPTPSPRTPPKPSPGVTTRSDGSTVQTVCLIAPPTPFPAPQVAPANVVGGPKLAGAGVIVDKPESVPAPPDGTETSYVIADMGTGEVLAAKNPHAWLLPASTLKTLTSLVVMPAVPATTKLVATDDEVNADGTRVGMVSGATYTVDDLFHGLVLMSGNDTAYALADAFGGRDKTIAAMNAKAAELGAWDTVAVDPSGLDAPGQRSSAYDLALLGRAVMQLPAYRQVAATKTYTFPGGTDRSGKVSPAFEIQNHNQLLDNYPGTIGVKNGYTTGARNTFVGAVTRGGRTLLITQMGAILTPSWQRQAALLDWAFANAGQLRPVGTLVAPGAAQPPELGGTPAPTTAGTPVPSATTKEPIPTATTSLPPVVAADALGPGGNPGPWLLASAGTAARNPVAWLVVVVVGLVVVLGLRRWVRRAGPED